MTNTQYTSQIWDDFSGRLRSFLGSRVRDTMVVEDLLQDVFVKIHSNIDGLRDSARLQSWVFQIARNTLMDHYRRHRPDADDQDLADIAAEPLEESAIQKLALGMREMILKLPDKYREALILTELNGLTQVEMARQLGISVSGAKSRVQRGREMVRKMLLECCHFEFDRRGMIIDYHPIDCHGCDQGEAC